MILKTKQDQRTNATENRNNRRERKGLFISLFNS